MKTFELLFFDTQMSDVIPKNKVKLDTLLWQIRELCRKHKLQVWGNQSLANQIYQDLLFIYHVPNLCASGHLELDTLYIGDGKITEISYRSLLSLKEPTLINTAFKRLWKQLQSCALKPLFDGRDFVMFAIEKKDAKKYTTLLLELMNYLASIELEKYDSNAGYTYFKKDLNKAIAKTFGQFYTPSSVTASVVKQVDPKTGESVLDPSSGSCSFLAEAANHIAKSEGVDMVTAFKDLYGTEVEPNIYAEGVMNMFINFGILPDMTERIREVDALLDMAKNTMLFKKIVANPPFGADARSFLEFYYQTIIEPPKGKAKKGTKKVILNSEVKCEIPFPKISESAILFFQYIVQKLAPGGKAGVVMSATIFNDGFKDMMKWFLECCSLEKVVINPAGTFKEQGTGIETFSFIFTKGSPTTKVDIVMLGAEDVVVRSLTIDQIKEAGWKLQVKEEEEKVAYTGEYELKKLGDVCEFNNVTKHDTSFGKEDGEYPFYTGAMNNKLFTDTPDIKHLVIIMNRTNGAGKCNLYIDTNCAVAGQTIVFCMKDKNTNTLRYLYYYLSAYKLRVEEGYIGSNHKNMSNGFMEAFIVEFPPLPIQQEIVATLDRIFADPQDMKDCLAFTDKAMDIMLKDPSGKLLEDVMVGLRLKRSHQAAAASIKAQMGAIMRSLGARGYEKKKLGDVYNDPKIIKRFNSGDRDNIGEVPFFNGKWSCPDGTHSDHSFEMDTPYFVMIKDGGGDHNSDTVGMGKFFNVTGKCAITSHNMVLSQKAENGLSHSFVYHYLCSSAKTIRDMAKYSINLGSISKESIMNFQIPCPPLPIQQEILAILNEMESELKTMEQMAAKAEQRAKYILDGYLCSQKVKPEVVHEVVEPVTPVNEVVEISAEPPKQERRVLKSKKPE
jgi:restriction endonuclease S subunit